MYNDVKKINYIFFTVTHELCIFYTKLHSKSFYRLQLLFIIAFEFNLATISIL